MKPGNIIIATIAVSLAGCAASPAPLPRAAQGVALVPISSKSVTVREPALQVKDGRLQLVGFVVKVYEADTTEKTHLDVAFLDASGARLAEQTTTFYPQRLTTGRRAPNRQGHYTVPLDPLVPGTQRIEVRAHDSAHSSTP
jgi:hypothetical protein